MYTKGEWKVIQKKLPEVPFFDGFTLSVQSEELVIALCDRDKWDNKKQRLANAQLIAAAPDMYEVLKKFKALVQSDNTKVFSKGLPDQIATETVFEQMEKALAKAEGRET